MSASWNTIRVFISSTFKDMQVVHQEVATPGSFLQRRFSMTRRLGRVETLRR